MKGAVKTIIAGGVGVLLLAGAFAVFAEGAVSPATQAGSNARQDLQALKSDASANVKALRSQFQTQVGQIRNAAAQASAEAKTALQRELTASREALKQKLQEEIAVLRQDAKQKLQDAQAAAQGKIKTEQAAFQQKLSLIQDAQKKTIAARLQDQMNQLNGRWTTHFSDVLDRLDEILGKVQTRADKAAANGKNVASVTAAIQTAKDAIAAARSAVTAQAGKTYPVTFDSASKLRDAFTGVRNQLHSDLTGLRDGAVRNARDAVQKALQALQAIPGVDQEPQGAGTTTPAAQ